MIKSVRFNNVSQHQRREYGVATIPFAKGEWFGAPASATLVNRPDTRAFYLRAFGAQWNDGSYRYGQAYVPLLIDGNSEQVIQVEVQTNPHEVAPLPQTPTTLPISVPAPVGINGATVPANAITTELIETNPARTVLRVRYRTGNFVVCLYLYIYADQQVVPFEIRVTGSNPQTADLVYPCSSILLGAVGTFVSVYGAPRRGASRVDATTIVLAGNTSFGDGQSQCWYGNAYLPGGGTYNTQAAEVNPLNGISLDWRASRAYGPFGLLPEAPTQDPVLKAQYAAQTYGQFRQFSSSAGNVWDDMPLGLTKLPGAAGDQRDFGMITALDVMDSGRPELLEIYRFNALEDAMRPGHYCEIDGQPVKASAHPNWISWSGQTHWHPVVSTDRLGKTAVAGGPQCNDWSGKDNEHWSSNLLSAAALLTHSYQLLDELNTEAELFLSCLTVPSMKPGWATNSMGPARAIGRTYNAMAQNYLITGRADIRARVLARTQECIAQQWRGRSTSPVRPLTVIGPDARQLPAHESWLPWQESLGIPGLEAWHQLTGEAIYREIAVAAAASMVKYGWRIATTPTGQISLYDVGNAVRWYPDGAPITPEQYFDTTQTYYNPSGIMAPWTVTTLMIVRDYYEGVVPADVRQRATELLSLITAGRVGVYSRMSEWLV